MNDVGNPSCSSGRALRNTSVDLAMDLTGLLSQENFKETTQMGPVLPCRTQVIPSFWASGQALSKRTVIHSDNLVKPRAKY